MTEEADDEDKRPRPQWSVRRLRALGRFVIYATFLVIIGTVGYLAYLANQSPDLDALLARPPERLAIVLDREGREIGRRGDRPIIPIAIETIPDTLLMAIIVVEDRRFFDHGGVDWRGVLRAAMTNTSEGQIVQGGSTITQQLAKNMFLSPDRTLERKVQEMVLAVQIEQRFTKLEILELYLNRVYFGSGAWGVEAAARTYFGKRATQLTLGEAALLAGLLQAPSRYSPRSDRFRAENRASLVLDAMLSEGAITAAEHRAARSTPVVVRRSTQEEIAGHFVDYVVDEAWRLIDSPTGTVIIRTTLDLNMQRAAHTALSQGLAQAGSRLQDAEGAIVALNGDGGVRVMIGSRSYLTSQYNRAVFANRQPGSAFKPVVYAAALQAGLTPQSRRLDELVTVEGWTPRNADDRYRGPVTLTSALSYSLNTVAVRVSEEIGRDRVIAMADALGLPSSARPTPALALGVYEVSLLQLTTAYTTFANGGFRVTPYTIETITTTDQRILHQAAPPPPQRVIDRTTADAMHAMLGEAIRVGTGRRARLTGRWSAGKTGTSSDNRDGWFMGYVDGFAAGVWIGRDDDAPMDGVAGGGEPAEIWRAFMTEALADIPARRDAAP